MCNFMQTLKQTDKETRLQMGITIREIAKQAGVSPSTVSRVLNRKGNISRETQFKVISVARSLGYPVPDDRVQVEGLVGSRHQLPLYTISGYRLWLLTRFMARL